MKKAAKILLIIALVLGVAYAGWWAYNKFFVNKMKEIDSGDGWVYYLNAREKSLAKEEYYITYSKDSSAGEFTGSATIDDFGFYHKWNTGNEYVVKIGSNTYGVFTEDAGNYNSSTISLSDYNNGYLKVSNFSGLEFIGYDVMASSENDIKNAFYGSYNIVDDQGFKHVFGVLNGKYVWKTTYTCIYEDSSGNRFAGNFTREVIFDTLIREVNIKVNDKEVNDQNKTVKKGKKRTAEYNFDLEYNTNQSLVKSDFSSYPAIG